MEQVLATTPFGRRSLSRAMLQTQADVKAADPSAVAHKWRIWRNLTEAKDRLGISDRALAVLNALLSFQQEAVLSQSSDLVVFPSNRELSLRAHGMAPATLRRHLAALVEAGLVIRRDSPNGKRYARRGEGGEIEQAYGFDLAPLVLRAAEFETLADEVRAERRAFALLREQISILRRDIGKSIEAGLEEGLPGDWTGLTLRLSGLSQGLLRRLDRPGLEARAAALRALLADVQKLLENLVFSQNTSVDESQSERHIQNSNPDSFESEPDFRGSRPQDRVQPETTRPAAAAEVERAGDDRERPALRPKAAIPPRSAFPLSLVLDACPDLQDWSATPIQSWHDFTTTAAALRPALGISPSAWDEAREALGEIEACICLAAMLQKSDAIKSPGGYLRALTDKGRAGGFSPGPMLMALLRAKTRPRPKMRA
jgi:replication initiation protein RepC